MPQGSEVPDDLREIPDDLREVASGETPKIQLAPPDDLREVAPPEEYGPARPKGPVVNLMTGELQGGTEVPINVGLNRMLTPGALQRKAKQHIMENTPTQVGELPGEAQVIPEAIKAVTTETAAGLGREAEQAAYGMGKAFGLNLTPGKPLIPREAVDAALSRLLEGPGGELEPTEPRGALRRGLEGFISEQTTPGNALMLAGIGKLPGAASKMLSAVFSVSQIAQIAELSPAFRAAIQQGKIDQAIEIGVHLIGTGAMGIAATAHAASFEPKIPPVLVPEEFANTASRMANAFENTGFPGNAGRPTLQYPPGPMPQMGETLMGDQWGKEPISYPPGPLPQRSATLVSPDGDLITRAPLDESEKYSREEITHLRAVSELEAGKEATAGTEQRRKAQRQQRLDDQLAEINARWEQRQQQFQQNELPAIAQIDPNLASERAALGATPPPSGYSGEVYDVPGAPQPIEKLNPPAHVFREVTEHILNRPTPDADSFMAAVDNLRPLYGIPRELPIRVEVKDVPVASTSHDGGTYVVTLPENAPGYMLAHEVSEIARDLGDRGAEPTHDNNLITAELLHRAFEPPISEVRTDPPVTDEYRDALDLYFGNPHEVVANAATPDSPVEVEGGRHIAARDFLLELADAAEAASGSVGRFTDEHGGWHGTKSPIPKPLQGKYTLMRVAEILRQGVEDRSQLTAAELRFYERAVDQAMGNRGPLTARELADHLEARGEPRPLTQAEQAVGAAIPPSEVIESDKAIAEREAEREAIRSEGGDTSFEFGMFGAPQFAKEVAKFQKYTMPELVEAGQQAGDAAEAIAHVISPTRGLNPSTRMAFRRAVGTLNQLQDIWFMNAIAEKARKYVVTLSDDARYALIDQMRMGDLPSDHPMYPIWRLYRSLSQDLYIKISDMVPNLPYLDNRVSVLWKVKPRETPEDAANYAALSSRQNRALAGNQYWKNELKYKSVVDGRARGGILQETDPINFMIRDLVNQTKFVIGNELWDQMFKNGDRRFVPDGMEREAPPGWRPMSALDQRFGRGWMTREETKIPGSWYLSPDAFRVTRNYLSFDPFRRHGNRFANAILNVLNSSKAALLMLPTFHAANEAQLGAGIVGLSGTGIRSALLDSAMKNFDPAVFIGDVASNMLTGPGELVMLGGQLRRYFKDPEAFLDAAGGRELLRRFPELQDDLGLFYRVGGRLGYREQYRLGYLRSIQEAYNRDSTGYLGGAAIRAVTALPEIAGTIGGPLFGHAIPQAKVAAWLMELQELKAKYADHYAGGYRNLEKDAGDLWNSIEDRFGMVDYDLRFWNRAFKTSMQLAMLSFGWWQGTVRMAGAGVWKPVSEMRNYIEQTFEPDPMTGKIRGGTFRTDIPFPKIPPETAALVKVMTTIGLVNSMVQVAYGNPAPWMTDTPILDAVFPRTRGFDEDGKPNRWRIMGSYGPALYALGSHPVQGFLNGISPNLRQTVEALMNRRFYDHAELYNENDSTGKKLWDGFKYAAFGSYPLLGGKQSGPIILQSLRRATEEGRSLGEKISVAAGGGPPPKYATNTNFENKIDNIWKRKMPYSKTSEQASQLQLESTARDMIRRGADPAALMEQLSARAQKRVLSPSPLTNHQRRFQGMGIDDALHVWQYATPAEKAKYVDLLRAKVYDTKTSVSKTGAIHLGLGMVKPKAWEGFNRTQIPVLQDRFNQAVEEGLAAKEQFPQ